MAQTQPSPSNHLANLLRNLGSTIWASVYQPLCVACDQPAPDHPFCNVCRVTLYPIEAACPKCAEPVEGPTSVVCRRCRVAPPPFVEAFSAFRYGGQFAEAIRRLKFHGRRDIARRLAPMLRPGLERAALQCDIIVPVPQHWRRTFRRGYNQVYELTKFASRGLQLNIDVRLLRQRQHRRPQMTLPMVNRQRNAIGAFAIRPRARKRVTGTRVLVVDDIHTTGATLTAATRILLRNGAREVRVFSFARAEN